MSTGIIILAAGNSSRLGKPKQLLQHRGRNLLEHVIEAAVRTPFRPIVVVLGAHATEIKKQISNHPEAIYVCNEYWQDGMGSSIGLGVSGALKVDPNLNNLIISVADQPHLSSEIFEQLLEKHESSSNAIVVSSYAQTIGVPVLFNSEYFAALLGLSGEAGAKSIINKNMQAVATVPFEKGHIDIDTAADLLNLIQEK